MHEVGGGGKWGNQTSQLRTSQLQTSQLQSLSLSNKGQKEILWTLPLCQPRYQTNLCSRRGCIISGCVAAALESACCSIWANYLYQQPGRCTRKLFVVLIQPADDHWYIGFITEPPYEVCRIVQMKFGYYICPTPLKVIMFCEKGRNRI